jgi:short-subunit dehydrogenase
MSINSMKGKVVVITGASSGIGKALSYAFASEGARLVLFARSADVLDAMKKELESSGKEVLCVSGDVSLETDCSRLIAAAVARFGTIDVLINNAGVSMRALFEELDLDVIRKVMDVNFWGAVYCTKFALPYLLRQKGSVVGISSIAGKKGLPARTAYSSSKFALEGFLETLRTENLHRGLHVLVACPGFTASNIRSRALAKDGKPQGESPRNEQQMMSADEVAALVCKAVKNRKRDLVLTLNGKLAVWLNRLFPSLSDRLVFSHMEKEPDSPLKRDVSS